MIKVVNKRTHKPTNEDVYVGRGSALGNPFTGSKDLVKTKAQFQTDSREEAISSYSLWINDKLTAKDKVVRAALNDIFKKAVIGNVNLVCYCAPLSCHGEVIKSLIEEKLNKVSHSHSAIS